MTPIEAINIAADFVAMPPPAATLLLVATRIAVFFACTFAAIGLGKLTGLPTSMGFLFGYLWGGLVVYGSVRQYIRAQ